MERYKTPMRNHDLPQIRQTLPPHVENRAVFAKVLANGINCTRKRLSGYVIVITLVALVAMTIGAVLLINSTTSGNRIAGNIAMRQSVEKISAIGFEMAMATLQQTAPIGAVSTLGYNQWVSRDGTKCNPVAQLCGYYPRELYAQDPNLMAASVPAACPSMNSSGYSTNVPPGIPTCVPAQTNFDGAPIAARVIDWFDNSSFPALGSGDNSAIPEGYTVRYVIDRQCATQSFNLPTWNPGSDLPDAPAKKTPPNIDTPLAIKKFCRIAENAGGNHGWTPTMLNEENLQGLGVNTQVYYRISVQVTGPRATVHFAQAIVLI